MRTAALPLVLGLLAAGALASSAAAQTGATSGAQDAETGANAAPSSASPPVVPTRGRRGKAAASVRPDASMNTGADSGLTPTGPDTGSPSGNPTGDLIGSTGVQEIAPAAVAPPSPAPPGGAPSGGAPVGEPDAPH